MSQIALDLPQHKDGNARHVRRERRISAADLKLRARSRAAETLRREQLHQIARLRSNVYRPARKRGGSPTSFVRHARAAHEVTAPEGAPLCNGALRSPVLFRREETTSNDRRRFISFHKTKKWLVGSSAYDRKRAGETKPIPKPNG